MELAGSTHKMYIPNGIDKETEEILYNCYNSIKLFCQVFMPNTFYRPFSKSHDKLFEALDDTKMQKLVIAMPRGWGKTSIVNKAYPARSIVFQDKHYIIPISAAGNSAVEFSENLKMELLDNEDLTDMFGPIKSLGSLNQGSFSTLEWVTSTGIKVMPRGAGQKIRGRQFKNYRPDLYIVDDLEDDEAVESEERRNKLKNWFLSAVKNSIEISDPTWRIIVIGTILHEDSLLANLLDEDKYPDWGKVRLELCDDDCISNWPSKISDAQCKALYEEYRRDDRSDIFFREFRNIPIAIDSQGFKPEYFDDYEEDDPDMLSNDSISVVLSDPAKTMKKGSADTAIVGLTVNMRKHKLWVREVYKGQMNPGEMYDEMLNMAERINALILAPEVTALHEYVTFPLKNAMSARGVYYIIIEVNPRQGKTGPKRSAGLIPWYRGGHIKHNRTACMSLEKHLMQWPRPSKWDEIDALSGIIYVLEEGEQYFHSLEDETPESIEAEYQELENEKGLEVPLYV